MARAELSVHLIRSPKAGDLQSCQVQLPINSTVSVALAAAGWVLGSDEAVGIWGRKVRLSECLADGDRLEIYRPLTVDPMQARHRRHALQGRRIVSRHRPMGPR